MTPFRQMEGEEMQSIFNNPTTTDETRKELLKELQRRSIENDPTKTCRFSEEKEVVFFAEWEEALIPGHIYSKEGLEEYRISQTCEYHFDKWCDDANGTYE